MLEPVRRALPPSVFARLADAARYVITGVSPDTWFGPLQPLQPMAPPEVKGRRWDYPFGANLNYIPRADDGVSFAELRGLADAARGQGLNGIIYPSVRHAGGTCIVALRPHAVQSVAPGAVYRLEWSGDDEPAVTRISG